MGICGSDNLLTGRPSHSRTAARFHYHNYSPNHRHPPGFTHPASKELVEIDAAGHVVPMFVASVPHSRMDARTEMSFRETGDLPPQQIIDREPNCAVAIEFIPDRRRRVERVRRVRREGEDLWSLRAVVFDEYPGAIEKYLSSPRYCLRS